MKAIPHSYGLHLSKVEKTVIEKGIRTIISNGKLNPDSPGTMARALEILERLPGIALIITAWDAEYILVPVLNSVPVCMLEDSLYSGINKIAKHEPV